MTVKTTLLILFLTGLDLAAQTPLAPVADATNRDEILRAAVRRAIAGETNAPAAPNLAGAVAASAPGAAIPEPAVPALAAVGSVPGAPPPSMPAAPPASAATAAPPAPVAPAVPPAPAAPAPAASAPRAPAAPEEIIAQGMIDLQGADLISVLDRIYGPLVGRTILRASLPNTQLFLKTQTPLTKKEAIQVLDTVLALNAVTTRPAIRRLVAHARHKVAAAMAVATAAVTVTVAAVLVAVTAVVTRALTAAATVLATTPHPALLRVSPIRCAPALT